MASRSWAAVASPRRCKQAMTSNSAGGRLGLGIKSFFVLQAACERISNPRLERSAARRPRYANLMQFPRAARGKVDAGNAKSILKYTDVYLNAQLRISNSHFGVVTQPSRLRVRTASRRSNRHEAGRPVNSQARTPALLHNENCWLRIFRHGQTRRSSA